MSTRSTSGSRSAVKVFAATALRRFLTPLIVTPFIVGLSCFNGHAQEYLNDVSRGASTPRAGLAIEYDGFTEPKYNVLVAASEMGRLETVEVKIGDRIKRGQLIARLDDELQRQAVTGAKIRAEMRGELEAAEAESELMKLRVDQLRSLAVQEMARPYELKRAVADWEIAQKQVLAAQEQITLRQHEWARYEEQLRRRRVLAPMDGIVAEVFHSPGEYVSPSDPTVIRLLVLNQIVAVFNVPVDEVGRFTLGKRVTVHLTSFPRGVVGKVDTLSPVIDGESGTVEVRILIDNAEGRLRAGDRCHTIGDGPDNASVWRGDRKRIGMGRPIRIKDLSEKR
ncbi:MAG: efflux RND transporter periplasmic adaptor subunit [Planctomycetota bacterium]